MVGHVRRKCAHYASARARRPNSPSTCERIWSVHPSHPFWTGLQIQGPLQRRRNRPSYDQVECRRIHRRRATHRTVHCVRPQLRDHPTRAHYYPSASAHEMVNRTGERDVSHTMEIPRIHRTWCDPPPTGRPSRDGSKDARNSQTLHTTGRPRHSRRYSDVSEKSHTSWRTDTARQSQ